MADWTGDRVNEFRDLRGRRVTGWFGQEMAIREDFERTGPQFADANVPCLQLAVLTAMIDSAADVTFNTYQREGDFGLWIQPDHSRLLRKLFNRDDQVDPYSIFRDRNLWELPTGVISESLVTMDDGVIAEVVLQIGGSPLLIIAGEIEERLDLDGSGDLAWRRFDESILVFTAPELADALPWRPPRPSGPS